MYILSVNPLNVVLEIKKISGETMAVVVRWPTGEILDTLMV